jgi:hypothetical protein
MWSRPVTDDTGNIKRQWRTCEKCGKVVSQKVKNDGGTSDSAISEALDSVTESAISKNQLQAYTPTLSEEQLGFKIVNTKQGE